MINPEELLQAITKLIEDRPDTCELTYHVCYYLGKFQCLPANHDRKIHPIICTLSSKELREGLTIKSWDTLLYHIAHFDKEKLKCLKSLKP